MNTLEELLTQLDVNLDKTNTEMSQLIADILFKMKSAHPDKDFNGIVIADAVIAVVSEIIFHKVANIIDPLGEERKALNMMAEQHRTAPTRLM